MARSVLCLLAGVTLALGVATAGLAAADLVRARLARRRAARRGAPLPWRSWWEV